MVNNASRSLAEVEASIKRRLKYISRPKSGIQALIFYLLWKNDKAFNKNWIQVNHIRGMISAHEAYLLYYLAGKCSESGSIVEIGSYEGKSTIALAMGAGTHGIVYAIDPHTGDKTEIEAGRVIDTWDAFLKNTKNFDCIYPIRKSSVDATKDIGAKPIALIFIDGWHSEKAVNEDIHSYLPLCSGKATAVFDDWNYSEVSAGIRKNIKMLPPIVGAVGNNLLFSNNDHVTKSSLCRFIRLTTAKRVLKAHCS